MVLLCWQVKALQKLLISKTEEVRYVDFVLLTPTDRPIQQKRECI